MTMTRTYRRHVRYRVTGQECRALREQLASIRQTDNRVHTLRFTSYRLDAETEKQRGRYALHYFDNDPSYLFLERRGEHALNSAILTEAECRALLAGDTDWLLGRRDPLLHDLHDSITRQMLLPSVLLSYRRERFDLPDKGAWLALNTDIRTTLEHMDFLDPEQLAVVTAKQPGEQMLEVGCQEELPEELAKVLNETVPQRELYPTR